MGSGATYRGGAAVSTSSSSITGWVRRPQVALVTIILCLVGIGVALATPPSGNATRNELAKGTVTDPVSIQTSAPTDFHIQVVTLDPGAATGWHTHPGPEYSIVKKGTLTLIKASDCKARQVTAGQAIFIPGGVAHFARNDGAEQAEIYVTYTVPSGSQTRGDAADPNCPA